MDISGIDLITLLSTEIGRLVAMFAFFYLTIEPIRNDVHMMSKQITKILIGAAKYENLEKDLEKLEDRVHSIEIARSNK